MSVSSISIEPNGSKPKHLTIGRIGLYCFILMCALFFLMPLYVMENFFSRANLGQAFAASIIMFISVVCILAPWAYYEFYFRNKEAK